MSSFSSVIRKPGAKVAPKVAPRRNIIRKTAQPQSQPQSPARPVPTPTVDSEDATHAILIESAASPQQANEPQVEELVTKHADSRTQPAQNATRAYGPPEVQSQDRVDSLPAVVETTSLPEVSAPVVTQPPTPNWPTQKSRPERNSVAPRPRSAGHGGQPDVSEVSRSQASGTGDQSESVRTDRGSSSTTHDAASPETPRPRSKRKQPPRGSARIILAQPALVTPPTTQPSRSPTHDRPSSVVSQRAQSVASQRSEAEETLSRINTQLQRVGDIAAEIVRRTPAPETSTPLADDDTEETTARSRPRKRRKRNDAGPQSIEDQAAEIVASAMGTSSSSSRQRRKATPENAEEYEIEEENTMMFDLCDEKHRYGKKSEIEKQMEANWPEILKRRKEDAAERLARNLEGRRKKDKMNLPEGGDGNMGDVPDLVLQDGNIVVASREVDRAAGTTAAANAVLEEDVREDTDIYKRVNSSTVGPSRSQIAPGQQWDDLSTEQFYQGLKMFGTDFKMISNMIPGKNRRQVKLKYNVEERVNWAKVQRYLAQKEEVNLEAYATMTGLEFSNVSDVYKQMEEDEKKLREEDEQRRRDEGIISQQDENREADVPLPSIEGQDGEPTAVDANGEPIAGDRQSTAAASRLGSTTTGRQTAQPQAAKKKQQVRKSVSTTKRGRQANAKTKGFEGVEERLGDAADIGIPGA